MMWEGVALPFVFGKKVIVLDRKTRGVSTRALSLFAAKARRAIGLDGEVNVRITSSAELQSLNRRFRRKSEATDVLSFPSMVRGLAGDIAVSTDMALANANELGHSLEIELKILILHGLLHLAGHDHETDHGDMGTREADLQRRLKLPTGLIERTSSRRQPDVAARRSVLPKREGRRP